jgi:RND family efflux transporter MFP subunit
MLLSSRREHSDVLKQIDEGLIKMLKPIQLVLISTILVTVFSGCAKEEEVAAGPTSRPVKIFTVAGGSADATRQFPARVDASQRAELAFRVGGRLQEILVREGDLVEKDQLVARLDPTDYQITLNDRQATFDKAQRNFNRGKELVDEGNISRTHFDQMEAEFKTARAALNQAQKDLEYTELQAPFAGRIARRQFENFEEVLARQTAFYLQDVSALDVIIGVPESLIRNIRGAAPGDESNSPQQRSERVKASVSFEGRTNTSFPLKFKEAATKVDEDTQTYQLTFIMDNPEGVTILPGMTARVDLDMSAIMVADNSYWVPARAVQADRGLNPRVWVLDSSKMTVSSREVEIGRLSGSSIEITSGLEGGEEIVAVGAPYLAEGMQVTRMPDREQAIPRADDPA